MATAISGSVRTVGFFAFPKKRWLIAPMAGFPSVNCLAYGKGDGLPSLECSGGLQPAACKLADGRICFPTSKGLVVVNPDEAKINHLPPPVVIEDIIAGGHVLAQNPDEKSPLKIPPGLQRFEFHFTGLEFCRAGKNAIPIPARRLGQGLGGCRQ